MMRRPPRSTRTDTLFPYTTLCRSRVAVNGVATAEAMDNVVATAAEQGVGPFGPRHLFVVGEVGCCDGIVHRQVGSVCDGVDPHADRGGLARRVAGRSEERRVGKEWVSTCRSRGSPIL